MADYKTTWREKLGYGVGAIGLDLSYGLFYSYLSYYLSSVLYKERYGGQLRDFGADFWFKPQIFRYIDQRGVGRDVIFEALKQKDVVDVASLRSALLKLAPSKGTIIEQAFALYGK